MNDEYPEERAKENFIPREWYTNEQYSATKSGTMTTYDDVECGPPDHRTTVVLMPLGIENTWQGTRPSKSIRSASVCWTSSVATTSVQSPTKW